MANGFLSALAERPKLRWAVVLLAVLAVLTVVVVVASDDDEDDGDNAASTTSPVVTAPDEPVADEDLAPALLPAVSALGSDWIETQREDAASEVEPTEEGDCPPGPVPEGWLVQGEQHRTEGQALVEGLAITAGVVAEGVEPISLEDEAVVDCLLEDLRTQLAGDSTVEVGPAQTIGAINPGAQVSHVQYVVTGADGTGGTFDFVLVQRDRLVSLGLLSNIGDAEPTPLVEVARALDAPLQAALPALS